ncbi:MAG TPA: hypothetical protein VF649_01805 [Sphingomonas sp.]|uniref:hypothetical protein n=1 Tax=Sphingomonas sp. TaxID=28214 RepID=UPI002EDA2875
MTIEGRRAGERAPRRIVVARLLMLWVFVVLLYFLWEAAKYRGLYALLSEWQFEQFGHYLPILTFSFLVLLFGSPAALLLRARRRADSPRLSNRTGYEAAVMTGSNFRRILFGFSGGLAAAALVTLLWTLTLPRMAVPKRVITVGAADSIAPDRGPAILRGRIVYTRTAAFAQDLWLTRRGVRFAPVLAVAGRESPRTIRYFVELLPTDAPDPRVDGAILARSGVLMRNALPGSIVRLYRYAGYDVNTPYYVLYASTRTMRWPYYVTAAQLATAAVILLLAALFQHGHLRRVTREEDVVG